MKLHGLGVIFSFLFSLFLNAQPQQGFFSELYGEALRTELRRLYYNGLAHPLGYQHAKAVMYASIDMQDGFVEGVYSGLIVPKKERRLKINTEHVVPQSYFGKSEPMRSDIHHLFPTMMRWNSMRSNFAFCEIDDSETEQWIYLDKSIDTFPESDIDKYTEFSKGKFEPREEIKGNVARAVFYFYTMYPRQAGNIGRVGELDMFLDWHFQDPVDDWEVERNDLVEIYQGNRNPYIDFPELAHAAWGNEF